MTNYDEFWNAKISEFQAQTESLEAALIEK